jgi:hypothetical protein
MIGVDNDHILCVVDDAVTLHVEVADQVYVGVFVAWAIIPRVPKHDNFLTLRDLILY